jgi:hypothetical protein
VALWHDLDQDFLQRTAGKMEPNFDLVIIGAGRLGGDHNGGILFH